MTKSFNPTFPDFPNEDGTWPEDPSANETQNPLGRLTIKDVEYNSYINANARLTWTVIDGCHEFTVEAGRPDSITRDKLKVLKAHNVGAK